MIFGKTILTLIFLITTARAMALIKSEGFNDPSLPKKFEPEMVDWIGEAKEEPTSHETNHELLFFRIDGKKFNVIDSPDFVKFYHEKTKNYLLEIKAEKTPSFLFWGGNLVVKKFRIITDSIGEGKDLQKSLI